jgi:hypothetical protein
VDWLFYYFLWYCSPSRALATSTRFIDHTQRRATVGRTPLDEWSARRRDLYPTTHTTANHASGGIRTHDRSRRAVVDLRLRPRVHWDRLTRVNLVGLNCNSPTPPQIPNHLYQLLRVCGNEIKFSYSCCGAGSKERWHALFWFFVRGDVCVCVCVCARARGRAGARVNARTCRSLLPLLGYPKRGGKVAKSVRDEVLCGRRSKRTET